MTTAKKEIEEKKENSAMVEQGNKTVANQEKMRYRITPTIYSVFDPKSGELRLEIHLPGVKKENIRLKVLSDLYDLTATRDESAFYASSEYFPYDIVPDTLQAQYENGLLQMKAKVKNPLDEAIQIKIE